VSALLEAGIEADSGDISSALAGPCFSTTVLRTEVSESTVCLQLHFEYNGSAPLVQQNLPAKSDLENYYSCNLVFSSDTSVYRFTGKPVSQTTGLYYEYARWYDPTIGRFISADPMPGHRSDPQSLNRYVYVQNSPLNNIDPSGLDCFDSLSSFGGCAGNFLYSNTIGAAVDSYNWYQGASDRDRWAFWAGVGTAVGIGFLVGASCVVAACAGLALVGIGLLAGAAGSLGAADAYHFSGGQSEGGLRASMFWGGIGAGASFAASDSVLSDLYWGDMPGDVSTSFDGRPIPIKTSTEWDLLQYGNGEGWTSKFATPDEYLTRGEAFKGLNLPEYNEATFVRNVTVPKGTAVWVGQVKGGTGFQVWVNDPSLFNLGPWRPILPIPA